LIKIKHAPPISQAIPLSPDDLIRVEIISSTVPVEIILEGSCFNSQGDIVPFIETLNVTVALTPTAFNIRLGYEFLFSAVLHTRSSGIPDGSCYCRMSLCKSETGGVFPFRKLLAQGYVATTASIGYGSAAILGAPTDHKFMENIEIPNPAPGSNFELVCPDFTCLKLIALQFTLICSATVATRGSQVKISLPPASPLFFMDSQISTASTSYRYLCSNSNYNTAAAFDATFKIPLPDIFLYPGTTISSNIFSLQVDDQLSTISLLTLRKTIPFS